MNHIHIRYGSRFASQALCSRQKTPGLKTWVNHIAAMLVLCLGLAGHAHAAEFVVNVGFDGIDNFPGNGVCGSVGQCPLRAAIMEANANGNPDETDTIIIPEGAVITLSIGGLGGDDEGDLDINEDVQILGGDLSEASMTPIKTRLSAIDASGMTNRIFEVHNGANVLLQGISLLGGTSTDIVGGGAVRVSDGTLTIDRSVLTNNQASLNNNGGAILVDTGATLNLIQTDISSNSLGSGDGVAIYNAGTTDINRSSFRSNFAAGKSQIYNAGILSITNSTLSGLTGVVPMSPVGITSSADSALFVGGVTIAHHTFRGISYSDIAPNFFLFRTAFNENAEDCFATNMSLSNSAYNVFEDNSNCGSNFVDNLSVPDLDAGDLSPTPITRPDLVTYYYDIPDKNSDLVEKGGTVEQGCALTTDQRGEPRPYDGNDYGVVACDAGAIEFNTRIFLDGFES